MAKTIESLVRMKRVSKDELLAYAGEVYGLELSGSLTKAQIIAEIGKQPLQVSPHAPEPALDGAVIVTVTRATTSGGLSLGINGRRFLFPIGEPVTVPGWVIPTLETLPDIAFTKEPAQ